MSIGDIFYIISAIFFTLITFGIIRNYYRNKFDDQGRRIDMLDENGELKDS
jgi:uncharacterized membrane protein